jgi:uncharacterized membrane protein
MIAVGGDLLPEWAWLVVGIVAVLAVVALVVVGLAMFLSIIARVWKKLT